MFKFAAKHIHTLMCLGKHVPMYVTNDSKDAKLVFIRIEPNEMAS